ncbi:MFS transporter [Paenibacillus jamilae]|jgi:DHA1 family putative efflux transporter-like MFS transporter|uniref:MFS transporter n=1 Tax=Paenibacillus TaxID=44249 RepID=UPI00083D8AEA|nr:MULTISPECIES: MFS transporter [Paenibacillus]APQ60610.1 MFS transporter [Paenibacillus polymyxa]KAF6578478.1 MFS transporter [Paenibacillus sp. EKM212P]MCP3743889.1 MFS transporter [Paenibacillus sp. A3M_27_13]ODB57424.1 MFS transporter [Paenibacillus polymyxa]OMF34918.1 MFS transporter [Paenibacillus peoriae]
MQSTWKVYILAIVSFLVGTSEYIISGVLDQIATTMGITVSAAGQLITVFSLAYAIGTPILMAVTAKWDRRKLLLSSLGLFAVANVLSFVLPGFGMFIAARILMALGAGMVVVTALSIAAKIAPAGKQASSIATVTMGFTASLIIGVPLGRMISSAYGWKTVFLGIALTGIIALIVISMTIPRLKGDRPVPLLQQFALLKKPEVALGLGITFFWLGGYSLAYTYISPYLLNVSGVGEDMLSSVLLAFGIASLIGSKIGGYSADKKGIPFTLLGGMVLHGISLLLLPFAAHSLIAVFALLILWSFAAWTTGPTQQYNLVTLVPESSGVMLSLNQSTMQLAMAAGAGIGGVVVGQVSLSSITWFGAAGVGIAIVATYLLTRRSSVQTQVGVTE